MILPEEPNTDPLPLTQHHLVRDVIEKPWDDRELKRTIRNLLRERELRQRRGSP